MDRHRRLCFTQTGIVKNLADLPDENNKSTERPKSHIASLSDVKTPSTNLPLKHLACELGSSYPFVPEQLICIAETILNVKSNESIIYCCTVVYDNKEFCIMQHPSNPRLIILRDLETNQEQELHVGSFPEFQKHLFMLYIKAQFELGHSSIDLSIFDLSIFKSAGLHLSDIPFFHTVLSRANLDDIVACQGNLSGAMLKKNTDVTHLNLVGVMFDYVTANSFIAAGADFRLVLVHYLAIPPDLGTRSHKTALLIQYLGIERAHGRLPIDLSAFDLSDVAGQNIDFHDTVLSKKISRPSFSPVAT